MSFDVIITDMMKNDVGGLEVLAAARTTSPMRKSFSSPATAPSVGSLGDAAGGVQLPAQALDINNSRTSRKRAAGSARLRRTNVELNRGSMNSSASKDSSAQRKMNDVISLLKRVAPTSAAVLIQGENGTGKETVAALAQAIHQNSPRRISLSSALNCAALSDTDSRKRTVRPRGPARLPMPGATTASASSSTPTAAHCFSTKWAICAADPDQVASASSESGEITRRLQPSEAGRCPNSQRDQPKSRSGHCGRHFRSDLYHRSRWSRSYCRDSSIARRYYVLIEHFMKQFAKQHDKTVKSMSTAARRRLMAVRLARQTCANYGTCRTDGRRRRPTACSTWTICERIATRTRRPTVRRMDDGHRGGGDSLAALVGRPLEAGRTPVHHRKPYKTRRQPREEAPKCLASANGRCIED